MYLCIILHKLNTFKKNVRVYVWLAKMQKDENTQKSAFVVFIHFRSPTRKPLTFVSSYGKAKRRKCKKHENNQDENLVGLRSFTDNLCDIRTVHTYIHTDRQTGKHEKKINMSLAHFMVGDMITQKYCLSAYLTVILYTFCSNYMYIPLQNFINCPSQEPYHRLRCNVKCASRLPAVISHGDFANCGHFTS